jgi:hypothetical protein
MKRILHIDGSSGRIDDASGSVVFDPNVGPGPVRPNSALVLFEAIADDDVKVSVSYVELNGGFLSFFADHPTFGTSWNDWTEQKERARMAWLAEFLQSCGAPVGTYSWGEVQTIYDRKGGLGLGLVKYAAQQSRAGDARNARD